MPQYKIFDSTIYTIFHKYFYQIRVKVIKAVLNNKSMLKDTAKLLQMCF